MKLWDETKAVVEKHPLVVGIGVFVVGAIFVIYIFGGSKGGSGAATGAPSSGNLSDYYNAQAAAIAAGDQLTAQQYQMQAQGQAINGQVSENATNVAGAVSIATIQSQTALGDYALQAQTAQLQASEEAGAANLASTLSAQTQQAQIAAQESVANNQTTAQVSMNSNNNATLQAIQSMNSQTQQDAQYWAAAQSYSQGLDNYFTAASNDQTQLELAQILTGKGSNVNAQQPFNLAFPNGGADPTSVFFTHPPSQYVPTNIAAVHRKVA